MGDWSRYDHFQDGRAPHDANKVKILGEELKTGVGELDAVVWNESGAVFHQFGSSQFE